MAQIYLFHFKLWQKYSNARNIKKRDEAFGTNILLQLALVPQRVGTVCALLYIAICRQI